MEVTINAAFDWERLEALPGATAKVCYTAIFENLLKGGYDYQCIGRYKEYFHFITSHK
jgi:hypothetical protein